MRKLERIAVLDNQANQLRNENDQLAKLAEKYRSQVYSLKQELRWHLNNGCRIAHHNIDQLCKYFVRKRALVKYQSQS